MMSESRPEPKEFSIPDLDLQPFESSVTAQRYIATIRRKKGVKRVAITERTAQLIARLQQGWSLDQVADWLSEQYGFAIVRENVSAIIEEELVPRGLAYPSHGSPAGSNVQIRKKSLGARLLQGTFRRRLLIEQRVRAVCAPLADL
ncbi:MAG TPA: hypothetical protein VEZ90_07755, partial [Blastocatellia bacterium]|nr:hypothetical protein [Blastocatellia bacterium]